MKISYRVHAIRRMFERSISPDDVRQVLANGEAIADYPNDQPSPSRLVLGTVGNRAVHVVVAYNEREDETIVITVYEPDPTLWEPDFRRRRS